MHIGRFAPFYRWCEYAAFGRSLERQRFRHFNRLSNARSLLVLGEGDGRALERLLRAAPLAIIDVVEISSEMISLGRHRAAYSNRVRFFECDALTAPLPSSSYDGVVTLFFLDCFDEAELRILIPKIRNAMSVSAKWLVTDFAIPDGGCKRLHAKLWIGAMYFFFRLITRLRTRRLPPMYTLLADSGLLLLSQSQKRFGLIRSEVWSLPICVSYCTSWSPSVSRPTMCA